MVKVETTSRVIIEGDDVEALRQMAAMANSHEMIFNGGQTLTQKAVVLARTILGMTEGE
jgi:hypothetical protein